MKVKMDEKKKIAKPKVVLAFSPRYNLIGIFRSYNAAESCCHIRHQVLLRATSGQIIAIKGIYWREGDPEFEYTSEDLGNYTLLECDRNAGRDFKIYGTIKQTRDSIIYEHEFNNKNNIIYARRHRRRPIYKSTNKKTDK